MRIRVERLALASLLLVSLLAASGPALARAGSSVGIAPPGGIHPSGTIDPKWAWVVDLQPSASVVANLGPLLTGNSFQAANTVNKMGKGWYRVTMGYMGAPSGNVLVSAIS